MSDQDVKPVSAATGTFAVVTLPPSKAGNTAPETGKNEPVVEKVAVAELTQKLKR